MKKKFTMGVGKYYFNINSGNSSILIHREKKRDAVLQYHSYKKIGKDCEWLGVWNGKSFDESSTPNAAKYL